MGETGAYYDADEQYDLRREAMAHEPTKRVEREWTGDDGMAKRLNETTHEHLSAVELGQTAKGDTQIKSVKVYGPTAQAAAEEALEVFRWLRGEV